ncbi:iron-sulfur cluster assembly scaffold protein [Novosphingobium sp. BW1]|uniref:iron-sulfur cluster assembly scaffold protein n=1 Tax=Novosphingobium sp. BW1 TaxID=2592621 RepID=UPI0011DECE50|nr:iron-sulfur cluster assembly scaffold protein [Novosphingobium sp. BW1]TYC90825.1 iron-sulfur cluster assembly scaffold protein [Novosphingobium sp. BW1]
MSVTVLYTPDVLALAMDLAAYPLVSDLSHVAEARSPTCGSQLRLGLDSGPDDRIARVGISAQACAIGQAAAAIFAKAALGQSAAELAKARSEIRNWLSGEGPMPSWPGFDTLVAVPDYPGRHGAVLLPWDAAQEALSSLAE